MSTAATSPPLSLSGPFQKRKTVTERHYVVLTDLERLDRALQGAKELDEKDATDAAFEIAKENYKAQTKLHDATIRQFSKIVRSGMELRDVDCEEAWDFETGWMTKTRIDTGKTVEHREMTFKEKQMKMDLD